MQKTAMEPFQQRIFNLLWPHRPPNKDEADINQKIEVVANNIAFIVRWNLTPIGHYVEHDISVPITTDPQRTVMAVYIHAWGRNERILSASVPAGECILDGLVRAISDFMVENRV